MREKEKRTAVQTQLLFLSLSPGPDSLPVSAAGAGRQSARAAEETEEKESGKCHEWFVPLVQRANCVRPSVCLQGAWSEEETFTLQSVWQLPEDGNINEAVRQLSHYFPGVWFSASQRYDT